jgi:hypothetical protein
MLPERYRYIAPYQDRLAALRGRTTGYTQRARRRAGIRLDETRSIGG